MRFLPGAEVIVVDSGSDASLELIRQSFPDVTVFRVRNHSMANTVNEGLKRSTKGFIIQMNADVYIEEATVPVLLNKLRKSKLGMVGPICKNARGEVQNQGFLYRRYFEILRRTPRKSIRVAWLSGACMLLKREALEQVGAMNSSLRFYNEDMEWCWRLQKAGWQCELVNTSVTHLGGSSTPRDARFIVEGYRGGFLLSRWYKPRLYQRLHKQFVLLEASQKRNSSDSVTRAAFQEIFLMFQQGTFETSPFGETLDAN